MGDADEPLLASYGCEALMKKRLLCGDSGQALLCFPPLSGMNDDATQDVFRVPSN